MKKIINTSVIGSSVNAVVAFFAIWFAVDINTI
jgi:hypothetical protein